MKHNGKNPSPGNGSGDHAGIEAGFDRWLSCRLHEAHDGVLREALPEELLRLTRLFASMDDPTIGEPCEHKFDTPTQKIE